MNFSSWYSGLSEPRFWVERLQQPLLPGELLACRDGARFGIECGQHESLLSQVCDSNGLIAKRPCGFSCVLGRHPISFPARLSTALPSSESFPKGWPSVSPRCSARLSFGRLVSTVAFEQLRQVGDVELGSAYPSG